MIEGAFQVIAWVLFGGAAIGTVPALFALCGYDYGRAEAAQLRPLQDADDLAEQPDLA